MQILMQICTKFLPGANLSAGHELHNVIIERYDDTNNFWHQMSSENHWVCRSKFKVISYKICSNYVLLSINVNGAQGREEERGTPSRSCTTNIFLTDSSVLFPFQRLPHMQDMGLKTNAFLYVMLPSFFLFTFQWLIFVNCILRNFDCIKVFRSGLWSYCHYAGSPPTNLPTPYQTPSTFAIQEETTLRGTVAERFFPG